MERGETMLPPAPEGVDLTREAEEERRKLGFETTLLRNVDKILERTVLDAKRASAETRVGEKPREQETSEIILRRADAIDAAMFEVRLEEAMSVGADALDSTRVARVRGVLKDINACQEIREAKPKDPEHPTKDLGDKLGLTSEQIKEGMLTNRSFILGLAERGQDLDTVYKPSRGEPDILVRAGVEERTGYRREWLARKVSEAFELGIIPPTVLRKEGEGIGSVQKWIEEAKTPEEAPRRKMMQDELVKLALLDYLIGNQDRIHGRNHLIDKEGNVYAIDNGFSFGAPLYDKDGEERVPALQVASLPLEQVKNVDKTVHTKVIMKHLQIFWNSPARQKVLKEAFRFALGEDAEDVWRAFSSRVQATLAEEMLPLDHEVTKTEVTATPEELAKNPERWGADAAKIYNSLAGEADGRVFRKAKLPEAVKAAA
jgi:hypothetical protein